MTCVIILTCRVILTCGVIPMCGVILYGAVVYVIPRSGSDVGISYSSG